jgi:23S rRNA (uracil1939-C5)-methyltransferase
MSSQANHKECHPLCPGCSHAKLSAEQSLALKQKRLSRLLSPWADRIESVKSGGADARWNYRLNVCLKTAWGPSGWLFGMAAGDAVIPLHDCPVHAASVNRAIAVLAAEMPAERHFPAVYYLQSGAQAALVMKTKTMPDMTWLDAETPAGLEGAGIEGLWIHLHPAAGKRVTGKSGWFPAWGKPESVDPDGLIYGPTAFRQVIGGLADHALTLSEHFLNPSPGDLMVDLYCGIGPGLTRWMGRQCRVIGVELNGEAVSCAGRNAPEATILRGRCGQRLPQLTDWIDSHCAGTPARLLYANPPRTGMEKNVLEWIAGAYRPERMAYLSCNAATLNRDLLFLTANGYAVNAILPYDFFPRTHHVECLALIESL